jgi:hypothetical protein
MRGGRGQILGLFSEDPVLRLIGPIGMGLSVGAALIVDLTRDLAGRTLADVRTDGPRLDELSPGRGGVATIGAGPITGTELAETVEILRSSWPAVVVRSDGARWAGPTVPYRGVYPGQEASSPQTPAVWQVSDGAQPVRLAGIVLPRLSRRSTVAMLRGHTPAAKRWVDCWKKAWEIPWA